MSTVALAHHWLVGMRGGERVLEQFCLLFPDAPIYTIVADPDKLSAALRSHSIHTSMLQRLPGGVHFYKQLMPLFPWAVRELKASPETGLVISSDASVIKGLTHPKGAEHVCYCHSPPRYLWDMQDTYLQNNSELGQIGRSAFRFFTPIVRNFDLESAKQVSHFIANSRFVQSRIKNCYGRNSIVIHPPVAVQDFSPIAASEDFYLVVSELTPYKRIDIAVEAFTRLNKKLVVIGKGSEWRHLQKIAGPSIQFLGSQPFSVVKKHFETCRAFIFPGIEDFGITPLEAQASGKPVIGFPKGGLLETTIEGKTALYFYEQTAASLMDAVKSFESGALDCQPQFCRSQAELFSPENFRKAFRDFLTQTYPGRFSGHRWGTP